MANETKITAKPGEKEFTIERVFDAPRELVWRAYTDPELIPQWWGPRGFTTKIEENDFKPGGKWRWINTAPDGSSFAFYGEYREIKEPERIVWTFEFEGVPGHVSVQTAKFEEVDGKTKVTSIASFDTVEDRDGMIQSGMEVGVREGNERLDEVLENLKKVENNVRK